MTDTLQQAAIRHFNRYQDEYTRALNNRGPWKGLSDEEIEADILTADWVPNRAMWRARGLRGLGHAREAL